MIQEFKDFIAKGGVFEAAVAFVMALFFAPIVTAIVEGVVMPIIAAIVGEPNFNGITIGIGEAEILIGTVITAFVSFIAVAFVLFMMVKAYNRMMPPEPEDDGPSDNELLQQIRDQLAAR